MAAGYGYAAAPIESNKDVSKNDLYTGLGIAGAAGAVGLAYGMDQNDPNANKYWAQKRKEQRQEKAFNRRERIKDADENRREIQKQKLYTKAEELEATNSRIAHQQADTLRKHASKPMWQQRLFTNKVVSTVL